MSLEMVRAGLGYSNVYFEPRQIIPRIKEIEQNINKQTTDIKNERRKLKAPASLN